MPTSFRRQMTTLAPTIANGAALSSSITMIGLVLAVLKLPAAWTAAALTFQASFDGGTTWNDVYDDAGTEVTIASAAVVASRAIVNKTILEQLAGLPMIRLRSGTAGIPVNQAAERTFGIVLTG